MRARQTDCHEGQDYSPNAHLQGGLPRGVQDAHGLEEDLQVHGREGKNPRGVGGKFITFDGYINGTILELVPGEKIVQSWQAAEKNWPKDHFSKATFTLRNAKRGTRINFIQSGVPEEYYEHISKGWNEFFWTPLRKMLEKK